MSIFFRALSQTMPTQGADQVVDGSVHVVEPTVTGPEPLDEPLGSEPVIEQTQEAPTQETESTGGADQVVDGAVHHDKPKVDLPKDSAEPLGKEPVVKNPNQALDEPVQEVDIPPTQEAATTEPENKVSDVVHKRVPAHKAHTQMVGMEHLAKYDRRVQALHQALGQQLMITNFAAVARDHKLSAPLASAFLATPGFGAAVESFPDSSLYDVIPEPATSARQALALESFDTASIAGTQILQKRAGDVVKSFGDVLTNLGPIVRNIQNQVREEKLSLEASDVTDEVLQDLSCRSLHHTEFTQMMATLDEQLTHVSTFDVDDLRAHPETIVQSIEDLQSLVGTVGPVLGLGLTMGGLVSTDRASQYEPTAGTFAQKDITKTGLIFYLGQAEQILERLAQVAEKKDELLSPLQSAAGADMPEALYSDEVTYGRTEHVTLMGCYTTLVAKLIEQSIGSVSLLLSTVDSVLDVDDGVTA